MRKQLYKIKQLHKGIVFDFHGDMFGVKNDTMLIVIYIRGILEAPLTAVNGDGDYSVVLPCGMVHTSGIAFVFHTQLAFGIAALFGVLGGRNRLGILFRLGKVDGDIQIAVGGRGYPFLILADTVSAYIIRILAEFVKIFGSSFRRDCIAFPEFTDNLTGAGHKDTHDLRIK